MIYVIWKSSHNSQWYWHLRAANNEIIATSGGDGYHNKEDCVHAIGLVKSSANAQIHEAK